MIPCGPTKLRPRRRGYRQRGKVTHIPITRTSLWTDAKAPGEIRIGSRAALDRLSAMLGTGKATTKLEETSKAARYARVDNLFLAAQDEIWGRFDETEDRIIARGSAVDGDIDLFNYAAVMTLRHKGSVTLVEPGALPRSAQVAAILRY